MFSLVSIDDSHNQTHENIFLLETMQDYICYEKICEKENSQEILRALRTKEPVHRWNHLFFGPSHGCMSTGIAMSSINDQPPIINSGSVMLQKLTRIRGLIISGTTVAINNKGGYFPFYADTMTITSKVEYAGEDKSKYVTIPEDTKIINLENDPTLEANAIIRMETDDKNYSSITNLRQFNHMELVDLFSEFKSKGGKLVYVYTTGIDVEQMYLYSKAFLKSGIEMVEFEFVAGETDNIREYLTWLEKQDIKVLSN